jgi:hypothetical protein
MSFLSLAEESIESFFSAVVSPELLHAVRKPANAKIAKIRFMIKGFNF